MSRVTDRWKEDNDEIRESLGDVEDSVGRVEEDCKAKGMQIDVLSDQARRISCNPNFTYVINYALFISLISIVQFQILKLMNVFEDERGHVSDLEDQISALEEERASAAAEQVQQLNRTMFDLNAECKSKVAMLGEQLSDAQAQLDLNQGWRRSEFLLGHLSVQ